VSVGLTNNLWETRRFLVLNEGSVFLFNNLVRGGTVLFDCWANDPWVLRDNAFDTVDLTEDGIGIDHSYNAFINSTNRLIATNALDLVLSSFNYAVGPLGSYYQSSTNLVNRGSRMAATAGLYHYTVSTNLVSDLQVKEGNTTVDIGFHRVATDASGNPLDGDGDCLPDYYEDRDGDANFDAADGETNWQVSENGTTSQTGLQVFTPWK
jgi:hypothetical protein